MACSPPAGRRGHTSRRSPPSPWPRLRSPGRKRAGRKTKPGSEREDACGYSPKAVSLRLNPGGIWVSCLGRLWRHQPVHEVAEQFRTAGEFGEVQLVLADRLRHAIDACTLQALDHFLPL